LKNKDTLNRKLPPAIHEVTELILPTPSVYTLDNGIKVYETCLGTQDIMKVEVLFLSGRPHEHKRLVSRATSRMLREGTASYTSAQLAEQIDFYAGTIQTPVNLDMAGIVMYCMTKHFPKLLPLLAEMVQVPAFNEKELDTFVENSIQHLMVDLSKNDVIAYRKITELMYGENHPYGYNSMAENYRALTREDLLRHHNAHFTADNCLIFVSGKTDEGILNLLNQHLGQQKTNSAHKYPPLSIPDIKPEKVKLKNPDTLQSAIRIGRRFGNRHNPDFNGFFILNTLLGGYFGSRLMTNIREQKGYTYGIYSALDLMHYDGYFYISSEVGNSFVKKTLTEIYKEMEKLQKEPVKPEELKMVRNYILGNMLNMIDGPFAVSDVIKSFVTEGVNFEEFQQFVKTALTITPEELQHLAQKYFNKEDMFEVIVGS
jgi:zinc protease